MIDNVPTVNFLTGNLPAVLPIAGRFTVDVLIANFLTGTFLL